MDTRAVRRIAKAISENKAEDYSIVELAKCLYAPGMVKCSHVINDELRKRLP